MKIAYLILAHHMPEHLPRLVRALNDRGVDFDIHVDAKTDMTPFLGCAAPNVHFVAPRIPVKWGRWSLVEATLALMRQALSRRVPYDYLVLLSGACYPIRSRSYIQRFLEQNQGGEFIQCARMPEPLPASLSYAHLWRQGLGDLQAYIGSSWWALTSEACRYILDFPTAHQTAMKYFEKTRLPEEMFFQTVLANSPFAPQMRRKLTYADWSLGGSHPADITPRHLRTLEKNWEKMGIFGNPSACFTRKIPNDGGAVVDLIDNMVARLDGAPYRAVDLLLRKEPAVPFQVQFK